MAVVLGLVAAEVVVTRWVFLEDLDVSDRVIVIIDCEVASHVAHSLLGCL